MGVKYDALLAQYDALLDEMREICNAATPPGNFTPEQRTKLDKLEADEAVLRKDIRSLQTAQLPKFSEADNASRFLSGLGNGDRGALSVLKRSDKFTEAVRGAHSADDERLSLGRLLRGYVTGEWSGAEAEARAMSSTPTSAGGILIPTVLSARIIDRARAVSAVFRAGASTVPMTSATLKMARVTGDPTAAWYGEGAAIAESDAAFDSVDFTARKMATLVRISNELLEDAQNIDAVVEQVIGEAIAGELDRVALLGSGTAPEPRGLRNVAGAHTVTAVGTPVNFDPFITGLFKVLGANIEPNAAIFSSRTAETIAKFKTGSDFGTPLAPPEAWAKIEKFVSNRVPTNLGAGTNESLAFIGKFDELLIGLRRNIMIEVSREAGDVFSKDQTLIRATWRGDVQRAHDTAFCVMTGILA